MWPPIWATPCWPPWSWPGCTGGHRGLVSLDGLVAGMRRSVPSYRSQLIEGQRGCAGHRLGDGGMSPSAPGNTVTVRGTVVIDVEACKGCDLCIDACPPRVLEMTDHEVNTRGYRYPRLPGRLHRLPGLRPDLPRLRVPGVQVRHPAGAGRQPGRPAMSDRALLEGSEAMARAAVAAGCRFFAGYPMTPVHRVAGAHGRDAARGQRRVHERRERVGGGGHGPGGRPPPAIWPPPGPPARGCR